MSITVTGVIAVLIIIVFTVFGAKNGLIKQIFDLFAFFITWALTWILYPYLASMLLKTPIYTFLSDWLSITLNDNKLLSESLPEFLNGIPGFLKDSIMISSKQVFDNLIKSTVDALAVLAINVISIVVLYVVLRLLSILIKKLGKKINNIMLIGPLNMLLGGGFGAVKGFFVVYVSLMLISFLPATKIYERVSKDVESSYILNFVINEKVDFMGVSGRWNEDKPI